MKEMFTNIEVNEKNTVLAGAHASRKKYLKPVSVEIALIAEGQLMEQSIGDITGGAELEMKKNENITTMFTPDNK